MTDLDSQQVKQGLYLPFRDAMHHALLANVRSTSLLDKEHSTCQLTAAAFIAVWAAGGKAHHLTSF